MAYNFHFYTTAEPYNFPCFIISKSIDLKAQPFTLLRNKILNEMERCTAVEAWCVVFEQVALLGKIISPTLCVQQALLLAQWEKGTLSLCTLFSKNKPGTSGLVVSGSVNIKLPRGKSPAMANCRVRLVMGKDEVLF